MFPTDTKEYSTEVQFCQVHIENFKMPMKIYTVLLSCLRAVYRYNPQLMICYLPALSWRLRQNLRRK